MSVEAVSPARTRCWCTAELVLEESMRNRLPVRDITS
jgi:hypothetical protein